MSAYRERLWPTPWVFLACALIIPATMAVFLPINSTVGVVLAAVFYLAIVGLLLALSPRIEVTEAGFRAGKAFLPMQHVGVVTGYLREDAFAQRGVELDARAYLVIRGWVAPVVKVEVDDPADPVPYWLVSSRHPDAVIRSFRALRSA